MGRKNKNRSSLGESAHACHEKSIALYKCPDFDVADLLGHESEWPYCFMLFSIWKIIPKINVFSIQSTDVQKCGQGYFLFPLIASLCAFHINKILTCSVDKDKLWISEGLNS